MLDRVPGRKWPALMAVMAVAVLFGVTFRQQARTQASLESLLRGAEGGREAAETSASRPTFYWSNTGGVSAEQLRDIVREELRAQRASSESPSAADDKAAALPAPSPASVEAFQRAQTIVADALASHAWTERQSAEFRRVRRNLTKEQFESVARQLYPAINAQQVRLETEAPPF